MVVGEIQDSDKWGGPADRRSRKGTGEGVVADVEGDEIGKKKRGKGGVEEVAG